MTPERLKELLVGTASQKVHWSSAENEIRDYVQELEADKARLDKLISFMAVETDCTVVLHWNDHQDFAQVKLTDGTVLGEAMDSDQITEDMDGDESSALVIRQAIDNAKGRE